MNIEQAKAIPLSKILEVLGRKPTRQSNQQSWYFAPWRDEKTASLHVHERNNWWYDFGIGAGGNALSLVLHHLKSSGESHTIVDALRWLNNMVGNSPVIKSIAPIDKKKDPPKLALIDAGPIKHPALIQYLEKRGIPLSIAKNILKEVKARNIETQKTIFALGLRNEENGYELRNPFIKSSLGTKSISFIRGLDPKPDGIHIFEGVMDYLSIITQNNGRKFKEDSIILNSVSLIKQVTPYIKGYGYETIYTWLDNDLAGKAATLAMNEFFKTEQNLLHKSQNQVYAPFKDINAWHMHKLEL